MITISLTRDLPFPIADAYAWLTDFQDDDADRTHAVAVWRKVLARSEKRIVMEGESEAFGRLVPFTSEIDLAPPDAWVARVVGGPRKGSVTHYKLTPTAAGSRLVVEYQQTHETTFGRTVMALGKPVLRRNLKRMWDGYEAAMRKDLARPQRV